MLSLHLSEIRANLSIKNAKVSWSSREGLLVQIKDDTGLIGLGEASPLPGYSTETLNETRDCLRSRSVTPAEAGVQSSNSTPILWESLCDLSVEAIKKFSTEVQCTPSARFAIESALLDLLGQREQKTIAELLTKEPKSEIPLNALLSLTEDYPQEARRLVNLGYRAIKIKVGAKDADREFTLIRGLREALPDSVTLRLDANGAWAKEEALHWLARYQGLASFIEQPTKDLRGIEKTLTPWAADESLQDEIEAEQIIQEGNFSALVLKPMALGGFFRCLDLAQRARPKESLVTHLFDGPIALAASCDLARALTGVGLCCGLDDHDGLSMMPEIKAPHARKDGRRFAPKGFGLGFSLEERARINERIDVSR